MTPFVLVSGGLFSAFLAGLASLFDIGLLADSAGQPGALAPTLLTAAIALVGAAIFYVMLVFAPRQVAEAEGSGRTWIVRFGVFVLGLLLGHSLAGVVRSF